MTTSLLWSALLIATFMGPMDVDAISNDTSKDLFPEASSNQTKPNPTEQQNREPSSTVYPKSTDFAVVVSDLTITPKKPTITKVRTSALPTTTATTTTTTTTTACPCDCLQGITKGEDKIGLLVFGGLTLGCVILLITTMTLACKLCHIQRHYHDYEICHVKTSAENGRTKADEPNESSIMMSEVFNDEGAARDAAENNQSKEKEEETASAGSAQSSVDKTAAPDNSDANESTANKVTAANKAEQPESSVKEATKSTAAAGTAAVAADNKAKDETDETDEKKSNTKAATAVEKSATEA
ncbi:uncharacterized protein LOC143111454 [Alosa pseudoharengus]|uniref:uncharacterized protein LOC143111454 n=1 Tax=Alosa pseudoharengus TaxID=34774 RepID=UPI003F8A343B